MSEVTKEPSRDIQVFEPPFDAVYTIEATAQIVDVPRRTIVRYCQRRLVAPAVDPVRTGFYFDREGIRRLRRIEELRPLCRDTLASIKIILDLMDEVARLNANSFSREQSGNGKSQNQMSTSRRKI